MKRFALSLVLYSLSFPLWAGEYGSFRTQLNPSQGVDQPRLAVVFQTRERQNLQLRFDLVKLKKELSKEMLRSYYVADPVITAEVLRRNDLGPEDLRENPSNIKALQERTNSNHLLLVELEPYGEGMALRGELYDGQGTRIRKASMGLKGQEKPQPIARTEAKKSAHPPTSSRSSARSIRLPIFGTSVKAKATQTAQYGDEFISQAFGGEQNDSWVDYNPTAFLMPQTFYVEGTFWLNNLTDVDIPVKSFKAEWKPLDNLQFSYRVFTTEKAKSHSSFAYLKLMLVDGGSFALSFGGRKRTTWNKENADFTGSKDPDINEKNDKRNENTLFLAGSAKIEGVGLLTNLYLDNQRLGAGVKYNLTEELKVFVDAYQNHYESPLIDNDASLGVQFYNPNGSIVTLKYGNNSEQVYLDFGYNF